MKLSKGGTVGGGRRAGMVVPAACAWFCLLLMLAPSAIAIFTRPLIRQLDGGSQSGGITVDGRDDLIWAQDVSSESLTEFAPAFAPGGNKVITQISGIEGPDLLASLATEKITEDIYNIGEGRVGAGVGESVEAYDASGAKLGEWGRFSGGRIAVDNSPTGSLEDASACGSLPLNPGECFVYVTEEGEKGGIYKRNPRGEPEPFAFDGVCAETGCGYVEGDKITGIPGRAKGAFGGEGLVGVGVDASGDLFAANAAEDSVYEYTAAGKFVQEFQLGGVEVSRVEGHVVEPTGVEVDLTSGHLVVPGRAGPERGAVVEFDIATGEFVNEITDTSEGEYLRAPSQAKTDASGDVYVLDEKAAARDEARIYVFGPGRFDPTLALNSASERKSTSVLLTGTVNDENLALTECAFEYVSDELFAKEGFTHATSVQCSPSAGAIPIDKDAHMVSAMLQGLDPGTTYHYRLVAHSSGELGGVSESRALAFTTPDVAVIQSTTVTNVSSASAELHAQIEPRGTPTTYHFEYLSQTAFSLNGEAFSGVSPPVSVPVPDGAIGLGGPTGGASESVAQHVASLVAGEKYYYRVVATNREGVASAGVCPGSSESTAYCTFTTLTAPKSGLPDGRSYELVTPSTKEGGSDMFALPETDSEYFNKDTGTPAGSGEGFLLETFSPFGPFPAAGHSAYVFKRNVQRGEWSFRSTASSSLGVQSISKVVSDPADLSRVAFSDLVGSEITEEGEQTQSLVGPPGGAYMTLHVDPTRHLEGLSTTETESTQVVGGAEDLSQVIFESRPAPGQGDKACPGAQGVKAGAALCEAVGGELNLIDVNDNGELLSKCGAQLGAKTGGGTSQAVSRDGARIFFVAPAPSGKETQQTGSVGCKRPPQLYVRVDGMNTMKISEPEADVTEAGSPEPGERPVPYPAEFVGASSDGSRVFFESEAWLTMDHPQVHDPELYECEIVQEGGSESCRLTRISSGDAGEASQGEGAQVFGVEAVAAGGDAIYYLAFGKAAPGANNDQVRAVDTGAPVNLYRYEVSGREDAPQTTFIARLTTNDRSNEASCQLAAFAPCTEEAWYATPDGRYLLFGTEEDLTSGAHTEGSDCKVPGSQNTRGRCSELYRYDAGAEERGEPPIVCVSCDGGGRTPVGNASFVRSASFESLATGPVRGMSDNGEYVFFDSPTPLVAGATNGSLNVYEWHSGVISLLDSGSEQGASFFLGYSPYVTPGGQVIEGGNVFIGTHDQLVQGVANSVGNVYDARICVAESPCIQPPAGEVAQCEASACRTPPLVPVETTPGSLSFVGRGNDVLPVQRTSLTRAQRLAKALAACRKHKAKKRRLECEKQARKSYGAVSKKKSKGKAPARRASKRGEPR